MIILSYRSINFVLRSLQDKNSFNGELFLFYIIQVKIS